MLPAEGDPKAGLEDQPVGGVNRPKSYAEMKRAIIAQPEVGRRVHLMPLPIFAQRSIVLESQHQCPVQRNGRPQSRLELELVLRAGEIPLDRRIRDQLERTEALLENRRQFEGPRTFVECRSRGFELDAQAQMERPTIRRAKT